jgi:hypothetical protein
MERPHSDTATPPIARVATAATPLSAVSWGAVLAGAAGAASLSLILAFLGFGLGMSSISPWAGSGASAEAVGIGSIVWITLTQIAAAALGGYLAGRLRTRWLSTHNDEVYFRDTAHGFLAWSVATLATAALFVSAIGSIASGGAKIGAAAVAGAATAGGAIAADSMDMRDSNGQRYLIDTLFRTGATAPVDPAAAGTTAPAPHDANTNTNAESARIFANAIRVGSLSADDSRYLAQVIANRTGISQADAEIRVRNAYAQWEKSVATAKEAADKARKAAAYGALWLFISLLGGAFFASWAAIWGGKRRDLTD